jgi:hypothetical protein
MLIINKVRMEKLWSRTKVLSRNKILASMREAILKVMTMVIVHLPRGKLRQKVTTRHFHHLEIYTLILILFDVSKNSARA